MYRYVTRGAHGQACVHREQPWNSPSANPASSTLLPVDDEHTLDRLSAASSSAPKDTLCSVAPYCRVAACWESSRSSWPVAMLRCWGLSDEETDAARRVLRADMMVRNCRRDEERCLPTNAHHHEPAFQFHVTTYCFRVALPPLAFVSSVQSSTCSKYRISQRSLPFPSFIQQITLHNDSHKASDSGHSGRRDRGRRARVSSAARATRDRDRESGITHSQLEWDACCNTCCNGDCTRN
jgi:hypothetical protein